MHQKSVLIRGVSLYEGDYCIGHVLEGCSSTSLIFPLSLKATPFLRALFHCRKWGEGLYLSLTMSIYMILNMYKFCFVSNAISKFFYFLPIQWKLHSVLIYQEKYIAVNWSNLGYCISLNIYLGLMNWSITNINQGWFRFENNVTKNQW